MPFLIFLEFKELPYDLKDLLEQKKLNLKVSVFFFFNISINLYMAIFLVKESQNK